MKKKIHQASLGLRFYVKHGWTRQAVADLGTELKYVIPRSFDKGLDEIWKSECSDWLQGWELDNDQEYMIADYFFVYNIREAESLDASGHEIICMWA